MLLSTQALPAADITSIWMGGNGVWGNAANWSPHTFFPNNGNGGFTYDAILDNGGSITLDQAITIQRFTLTSGSLTGGFDLTLNEVLTWSGGTMSGTGSTNANGGILFGNAFVVLDARTLNNAAAQTAVLSGSASLGIYNGAVFNNNGTFLAQNDQNLYGDGSGAVFHNAGTFTRDTATGSFSIATILDNTGTVNVETGTLSLSGTDGGITTGEFNVSSGATLNFNSDFNLTGTSAVTGAGTVEFSAGTVEIGGIYVTGALLINGGGTVANFNASASVTAVNLSGGTLGGTGTITASGLLTWSGGTMSGTGVTNANGGIIFAAPVSLDGRTLNNAAGQMATMADASANLSMVNAATFNNNGTFLAQNEQAIFGGDSSFINNGTFTRDTAAGLFSVYTTFDNSGTVEVRSGTLALASAVVQHSGTTLTGGTWRVFDNSTLTLSGSSNGIVTNRGDITLSGAGSVFTTGGGSLESQLTTNTGALRILDGRNFTAAKALTNSGLLQVNASTLNAPSITVTGEGSILSGSGTVVVNSGPVTVDANATLQGGDGTTGTALTIAGALTMNANSVVKLALGPGGTHSTLARTGTDAWSFQPNQAFTFLNFGAQPGMYDDILVALNGLTIDPTHWTITNAGFAGEFTLDGTTIDLNLTAVPEPSTWIAGALALGLVAWSQRQRFSRRALAPER